MSIFRGVDFRPGGSSGIDFHVADHLRNLSRMVSDPPILDGHKDGVLFELICELARADKCSILTVICDHPGRPAHTESGRAPKGPKGVEI